MDLFVRRTRSCRV